MKLKNLKYALLIGAYIGAHESYAATSTFIALNGNSTDCAITGFGSFGASAAGTCTASFTAASAAGAVMQLNTTYDVVIDSSADTFGAVAAPLALAVMNTGKVTLNTTAFFGFPVDSNGAKQGALRLMGGGTVAFLTAVPTFAASTAGDAAYIDVLKSSTMDFGTTGFSLAADIVLQPSQTLYINVDSGTSTISGIISGTGNIIKTGNGILKLTGVNTYTGTNTCNAGTLYLAPLQLTDGQTYSTAISIGDGIVQPINVSSGSATISSIISGAGQFQKLGAGILTLSGANTFTGKILFGGNSSAAGTIIANHATALGAGSAEITVGGTAAGTLGFATSVTSSRTISLGSTLNVSVPVSTNTATLTGVISGASVLTKSGLGKAILSAANTYTAGTTVSGGILHVNSATAAGTGQITTSDNSNATIIFPTGTTTVANAIALGTGSTTFSSTAANDTTTLSGIISGAGGTFVKDGLGSLTMAGLNTYTGGNVLKAGKVNVGVTSAGAANGALGSSDATTVVSGASTLAFLGNYALSAQDMAVNAALTVNVATGATGTIVGDVSTNAAGIITKIGTGTLTFSSNTGNNQQANTVVAEGRIIAGNGNPLFGTGNAVMAVGTSVTTDASARIIENRGSAPVTFTLG